MLKWVDVELISCFKYENSHLVFFIFIKRSLKFLVAEPVKQNLFSLFLDNKLTVTIKRKIICAHRHSFAIVEVEEFELQVCRFVLCIIFNSEVVKGVPSFKLDRALLRLRLKSNILLLERGFLGVFPRNEDKAARFEFVIILDLDYRSRTAQKSALCLSKVSGLAQLHKSDHISSVEDQ